MSTLAMSGITLILYFCCTEKESKESQLVPYECRPGLAGQVKLYFVVIPHEISGYTLFFSFVARGIVVTCKTTDLVS